GVRGLAPRERLEHQLVAVQHVGVYGGERRTFGPDAIARHLEELAAGRVAQMTRAQGPDDLARGGRSGHAVISTPGTPGLRPGLGVRPGLGARDTAGLVPGVR